MSRFVAGGTNDEPTARDEEWLKAQEDIEAKRREKADLDRQTDGKSLYETLQANKAAKQEQFEESIRLRNQFRSLDEDEVEFLDSVLESTRVKEAEVKKQTAEELNAFRKQQDEAERAARSAASPDEPDTAESTSWAVGRKRKKGREDILGGVKLRRKSSTADKADASEPALPSPTTSEIKGTVGKDKKVTSDTATTKLTSLVTASPSPGLGLGAYSSDEDG